MGTNLKVQCAECMVRYLVFTITGQALAKRAMHLPRMCSA